MSAFSFVWSTFYRSHARVMFSGDRYSLVTSLLSRFRAWDIRHSRYYVHVIFHRNYKFSARTLREVYITIIQLSKTHFFTYHYTLFTTCPLLTFILIILWFIKMPHESRAARAFREAQTRVSDKQRRVNEKRRERDDVRRHYEAVKRDNRSKSTSESIMKIC